MMAQTLSVLTKDYLHFTIHCATAQDIRSSYVEFFPAFAR
ncbi:MAG: hypothetical protein KatS3mg055_0114 [Chloroflexus sp.]|nr:MAG: hypothetical protein KatS3mg055_0114 [Chloroflexus sp.]